MNREVFLQKYAAGSCGHIQPDILNDIRSVDVSNFDKLNAMIEDFNPSIDIEGMEEEEIPIYLASELVNFVLFCDGWDALCHECDLEKLKRWSETALTK